MDPQYIINANMAKHEIRLRINVVNPLTGVTMQVQEGKDKLLAPCETKKDRISFEFPVTVDLSNSKPNFLGKFAQGPKDARFVYVNSGCYAGQAGTEWNRRAKISLMKITAAQVIEVIETPGSKLAVTIDGVGRDGGPVCASIRSAENGWRIMK
jgi:hypothetical protein